MSENVQRIVPAASGSTRLLWYWMPPVLWMAAIFVFSTDLFASQNTGGLLLRFLLWIRPQLTADEFRWAHYLVRKLAHFVVYATLALLLVRAFRAGAQQRWDRRWALYSFFIVSIYALIDEYHQTFTKFRGGSAWDSVVDMCGGATALLCLWIVRMWQDRRDRKNQLSRSIQSS